MKLQGIFVPIAVPFDHRGDLYPVKVQHNIEKLNRTGLSGYVVSGDESIYLSSEEKIRMWEWVAQYAAPAKLLIARCGMPSVHETVSLANRAAAFGYTVAVLDIPREQPDAQLTYFRAVADQVRIPIIVPFQVTPQVALGAAEHPNVIALLGSSVSGYPQEVVERSDLQFLSASGVIAEAFSRGASGVFSKFANAAPYAAIAILEAHRTREFDAAMEWGKRISPACRVVATYGVAGLKYAMDLNGYYGGLPRLPLIGLTPAAKKEIEQAFDGLRG
jgi:4-hydroxy-2-oxoglutarate aldolase